MHWKTPIQTLRDIVSTAPLLLAQASKAGHGLIRFPYKALRYRRPKHFPIALKLALAFTLLIATGMITLGLLVGTNQSQLLEQQMRHFGASVVEQVAETAKEPLLARDQLGLEYVTNALLGRNNILGAAIYAEDASPIVEAGLVPPREMVTLRELEQKMRRDPAFNWLPTGSVLEEEFLVSFYAPVKVKDLIAGYVLLTFDRTLLDKARRTTITTVTTTTILALLLGIAASFYLGRALTRPIDQIITASRAISEGKYDAGLSQHRNDELGMLIQSLNVMGQGLLRKEQVEQVFSRYVSPQVAKRVLNDLDQMQSVDLGGAHVEASVLFADIVGFTSLSEQLSPQEVSALLNDYFSRIAKAVHFCRGHIDKYMGDCAMIVFGVPEEYPEHSFNAVACAWMITRLVDVMNGYRSKQGLRTVDFRIGVNSGTMLAGNMGAADRMEYTVVGDAVNLASRLSHAGEPTQIIFTEDMYKRLEGRERLKVEAQGTIRLRGKTDPVVIYKVVALSEKDSFARAMLKEIETITADLNKDTPETLCS